MAVAFLVFRMPYNSVIVLAGCRSRSLSEIVFSLGLLPLQRRTIQEVILDLRQGASAAIVVDREASGVDVLELVLNVRDIDQTAPIVVIGAHPDQPTAHALALQSDTHLLAGEVAHTELRKRLDNLINRGESHA